MEIPVSTKTYVITGATSGIGLACAELLTRQGATVIGVGRSSERCLAAQKRLSVLNPEASPVYLAADLAQQSQVRSLAARVQEIVSAGGGCALDGLVNNAGTFTYWLSLTPDGFETQWAVNYLAPFLLTWELLPLLQAAPMARVVTVSSGSHYGCRLNWQDLQLRRHYNGLRAYGNTKLADVLFTLELNRRLGPQSPVRAFAADPGLVKTDIGLKGTPSLVRWVWKQRSAAGLDPEESARGIVFLLNEPSIQNSTEIYWKHAEPKPASRFSLDQEAAGRLWALSEQMCGIQLDN